MNNVENIMNILTFCAWSGIFILCIILVVSGILRWISPDDSERAKRLYKLSRISFIVLCIILLVCNWSKIVSFFSASDIVSSNEKLTSISIDTSKITIKLLILGGIVLSVLIFFVLIAVCVFKTIRLILSKNDQLAEVLEKESDDLKKIMNTPIIKYVIIWGLLTTFMVLPLLIGESDTDSMRDVWVAGIHQIANWGEIDTSKEQRQDNLASEDDSEVLAYNDLDTEVLAVDKLIIDTNEEDPPSDFENSRFVEKDNYDTEQYRSALSSDLIGYFLFFIIILGVGFAVIKIFISIMDNTFKQMEGKTFLDEYSGSIGILSVGIALLYGLRSINLEDAKPSEIIAVCAKSFAIICFIVAATILTLEVIRLLMDMREKLIRQEAKYLFITLVGKATLLLSRTATSIYSAVSTIIGDMGNNADLEQVHEKLEERMVQSMYDHMDDRTDYEMTFSGFDRTVTRK